MLPKIIYQIREVTKEDAAFVGVLGAALGEIAQANFPLPDGFIISNAAYTSFIKANHLTTKINHLLGTIHFEDAHSVLQVASHIQKLIRETDYDDEIIKDITKAYKNLSGMKDIAIQMKPSLSSDTPTGPLFNSQKTTFPVVMGDTALLKNIKEVWASLFEARSIYYRHEKHIDHFRLSMAVIVQKAPHAKASGQIYTTNPLTHDKKTMVIEARLGNPPAPSEKEPLDHYIIAKSDDRIVQSFVADQSFMHELIRNEMHTVQVPEAFRQKPKLPESELNQLITLSKTMEKHYYFPLEISWLLSEGEFLVQSIKPLTLHPLDDDIRKTLLPSNTTNGMPLVAGIASGHVRQIITKHDITKILPGEIAVVKEVDTSMIPFLKKTYGIIAEKSEYPPELIHQLRTLGHPVIVGVTKALSHFKNSNVITLNGETGSITPGGLLRTTLHKKQMKPTATATKIFLSIQSRRDFEHAPLYQSDGIGLLPGSQLIMQLGIHPKKILADKKSQDYLQSLTNILTSITTEFSPRPVLYKLSDLTSAEYMKLSGGKTYETFEQNPILGLRGSARFIHDPEIIKPEILAIKRLREEHGLQNLHCILPFVRTTHELELMLTLLKKAGLTRSPTFHVWLSIDTPAQTITIDSFLNKSIDGIMINAESLSSLFSGSDPQNSEVSSLIDEENEALLHAYQYCIKRAAKHNLPSIITGKTLTSSHAIIDKVIHWGVSGIVTKPDGIENLRKTIYNYERKFLNS